MKIVRNRFIPFKGFKAMNVCGVLFVRKDACISEKTMNHERIHSAQMKELLFVFFYVLYVSEWLIHLVGCMDFKEAYRKISFEKEAYDNEENLMYLNSRRRWAWIL